MVTLPHFFRSLALLVALTASAIAQSIHWEPPAGSLGFNQTQELQLVFEGCEPKEDPAVPAVAGLQLQAVGQSSNMSIVNGRVTQTVTITFHARATQKRSLTIPAFSVSTNKGRVQVPATTYEVGDATVGQASVSLDRVANSQIEVPQSVWAGEIFPVTYSLNIARRYYHSPGTPVPEWNAAPLTVEEWAKPEVQETVVSGEPRIVITYKARGSLKEPGDVTLNVASQLVNLATGSASFGFFSRPNLEQYAITSSRPTLNVKPLPAGAPSSFNGAVGQFKLESKVVPASAAVGEPITWTLTLSGTGNWPDVAGLPSRDVSRDFRVVQPQARRVPKEGTLFDSTLTEDVVLIPTQPGTYEIGAITWTYFDPARGEYRTVTTPKSSVTITAPVAAQSNATPSQKSKADDSQSSRKDFSSLPRPGVPQTIPRDPLAEGTIAPRPWVTAVLIRWILAPFTLVIFAWILLALRRARLTDPVLPRRQAAVRLRHVISQLGQSRDPRETRKLIQQWQHDAAILWQIPLAVPHSRHFGLQQQPQRPEAAHLWADLWSQSERVLYGPSHQLPADWPTRANSALDAVPVAKFSVFQLFRTRNLLPFAAGLVAILALTSPRANAAEPGPTSAQTAYNQSDFATAEATWRKTLATQPTNWAAHHNLSLALAQQNRWGEAAAQALTAFVQQPQNPSVQWQLVLAFEHAGFAPGELSGFVVPDALHSVARLRSPAEWQRVLVLCAGATAAAAVLLLFAAYRLVGRWGAWVAGGVIALSLLLSIAASVSLGLYQSAVDQRAAIVWKPAILRSIPTEADTTQKTSSLSAGTVVVVDKIYLGWTRLVFSNGQTGWVRQDELVWLWK